MEKKRVISGWRKLSSAKSGYMKLRRPAPATKTTTAKPEPPPPNTVSDKASRERWDAEGGQPVVTPVAPGHPVLKPAK